MIVAWPGIVATALSPKGHTPSGEIRADEKVLARPGARVRREPDLPVTVHPR